MRGILKSRFFATILAFVGLALAAGDAYALSLAPVNLVDLIRQSPTIIMGQVTTVTDGISDIGMPYTEVTVAIDETLKGTETGTYTFRQYGLITARLTSDGTMKIPAAPEGIPVYKAGENVLLFLGQPASITGLRAPVGLGNGKFTFGAGSAENEFGNRGVFQDLSIAPALETDNDARILSTSQGAVNPDDLRSLIQRATDGRWVETCAMWKTSVGPTYCQPSAKQPVIGTPKSTIGLGATQLSGSK
jgi:hypothetical protein